MFNSNSPSAYKTVYQFYEKLYDNYVKRIKRAIWYCLEQYKENKELD